MGSISYLLQKHPNTEYLQANKVLFFAEMQTSICAIKSKLFKEFLCELKLCVLQQVDCK